MRCRHRVSAAEDNAEKSCGDGNQKRADKKIRGKREGHARIAYAAQIDDGDDDQNAHADGHRVRQQGWRSRNQRAHSRGNAHGRSQNVIGQERRCGKKRGRSAQVEARHGIRAAAGGIRGDGLAIREIHDHQQRDDRGADRNDVAHAEKAEGNQKAESRFRAVRR